MDAQKIEGLFVVVLGGGFWIAISRGLIPTPPLFRSGWGQKLVPWLGPLLVAFGVFLMFQDKPASNVDVEDLAKEMRKRVTLPMKVDDVTQLDDVRPAEGALGLFFTLTNVSAPDAEIAKQLEAYVRGESCTNPQYKKVFDANIAVRVAYKTPLGAEITSILLKPTDCK